MLNNGRKTIGVLIQQVNEEYQNLLCKGISERAAEIDYNVIIYSNFGGYGHDAYDVGEKNIVDLPQYEELDGLILAPDTMNLRGLKNLYREHIMKRCHCPVVSVRDESENCYNVLVDNDHIMEEIITHLIVVHKFTRINFLAGPKEKLNVNKRLESYKRILTQFGIEVEEERIYYGDLWKYAAYDAVDFWLNSSLELPQAIVCANDIMAMTVCKALAQKGIRVPEQIAVVGCDDIKEAEDYIPSISTVKLPVVETGVQAVDKIYKHNLGEKQPRITYVKETATIYRESCGCNKHWYQEISDRRRMRVEQNDSLNQNIIRIAQMSTDLAGLKTLEDVKIQISGNWLEYGNISHYFLCLNENWYDYDNNAEDDKSQYTMMLCGMKNDVVLDTVRFPRKDIIPKDLVDDRSMTVYLTKVHYLEHDYGYFGFCFKNEQTSLLTLQVWLNNVSSALENVRMQMELNRLVGQLEDMSIRDELTGLYNRRVLDTIGKSSLNQCIKDNTRMMFFIADMDKLKNVNDKYGHIKGDLALSVIAEAILKAADDDEICIRHGGDEFMAIGLDYNEEKVIRFSNRIVGELNNYNKEHPEFNIFISYGWNLIYPREGTTIEECLFTADYRMYQQKYNKVSNNLKTNLIS